MASFRSLTFPISLFIVIWAIAANQFRTREEWRVFMKTHHDQVYKKWCNRAEECRQNPSHDCLLLKAELTILMAQNHDDFDFHPNMIFQNPTFCESEPTFNSTTTATPGTPTDFGTSVSTNSTSTAAESAKFNETNHCCWISLIVALVTIAMLVGGIAMHRYAKNTIRYRRFLKSNEEIPL